MRFHSSRLRRFEHGKHVVFYLSQPDGVADRARSAPADDSGQAAIRVMNGLRRSSSGPGIAPNLHISHRDTGNLHRFCALRADSAGARLDGAMDGWRDGRTGCELHQIWGRFWRLKSASAQGSFELSTGKWPCLEGRCRKCKQNTRYCGFLLTCTIDSGIFSSAAVNGL